MTTNPPDEMTPAQPSMADVPVHHAPDLSAPRKSRRRGFLRRRRVISGSQLLLPRNRTPVPTHTRLATRRLSVVAYVVTLVVVPALIVTAAMAAGWWRTTGTTLAASSQDRTGGASGTGSGETPAAAPADPDDVKGSMTIQQVGDAFPQVSAAQISVAFGAPADTPTSTLLKDLAEGGGGSMDLPAFRTWLREHITP
jgi:hypothetical protein